MDFLKKVQLIQKFEITRFQCTLKPAIYYRTQRECRAFVFKEFGGIMVFMP